MLELAKTPESHIFFVRCRSTLVLDRNECMIDKHAIFLSIIILSYFLELSNLFKRPVCRKKFGKSFNLY